jgi:hypothetical protein
VRECPLLSFPAFRHGGARGQASIRYLIVHALEGEAAAEAEAGVSPGHGRSFNLVVGEDHAYQCLNDFVVPVALAPLDQLGLHIAVSGSESAERRAAYLAARACRAYKIPPRLLDRELLRLDFGDDPRGENPHHGPCEGGITSASLAAAEYGTAGAAAGEYAAGMLVERVTELLKGQV